MKQNQRMKLPDSVRHEGLVTERDIDPEYGLFTEEEEFGMVADSRERSKIRMWDDIGD
ncbi:hypothetical protein [Paenibacillus soyae]|uniref:Uncharacterized protein n=1 Tax=Paenibacillus soyae TaxID=2969249 RepID=A0A9X2MSV9_9BACL|nr:hypothetical protein [Paenibacillus soyae]MCR2805233.1 hypothetical protein [Paenibacillus soyae]